MSLARFTQRLEQATGLTVASSGASAIERALRARVHACEMADVDAYWDRFGQCPDELQKLIEAVVVPETWFFRTPHAFSAVARYAIQQWLPSHAQGVLRLLSLPCSTGEEAYTMAMTLIEAGLPPERFKVDGVDISGPALAAARRGIYGSNSFRGADLDFRGRHFERVEQGWRIRDNVRNTASFSQGNLLDPGFLADREPYDIVFCRNLLIYFSGETQKRAVAVLKRLLAPQGMLFVGHSESGVMEGQGFAPARISMAFAFRHATAASVAKAAAPGSQRANRPVATAPKARAPRSANVLRPKAPASQSKLDLDELHRIADSGQLAKAAQGCEAYIRERGASPEALLLLGLIKDAQGDTSAAAACYRKTLYLEPNHGEALSHLALLLQKQGDASGARIMNERLRRLDSVGDR